MLALDDVEVAVRNAQWSGSVLHVTVDNFLVEQASRTSERAGAGSAASRTIAATPGATSAPAPSAFALRTLRPVREAILSELIAENDVRGLLRCRNPRRTAGLQLDGGRAYLQVDCGRDAEVSDRLAALLATAARGAAPRPPVTLRYRIGGEVPFAGGELLQWLRDLLARQPDTEVAVVGWPGDPPEPDSLLQKRLLQIRSAVGSSRIVLVRDSVAGPKPVDFEAGVIIQYRF